MAIDTTPSTVATNALQALPFDSLIGGPLQAAIKAQAMAARTSWDFIQQVGLNTDPVTGNKTAVSVSFQYQKGGQMVNLVVPLLTIVPIPYIAIDNIDIDFKANISASASSVTVDSESTEQGGSLNVSTSVGWGVFSASADFKANYSSKKDSTATQESKYSVEYTMNVAVHAMQASMPAGLASVLNILQSSITESNPNGNLLVSPPQGSLDAQNPGLQQQFQVTLLDSTGLALPNTEVTLTWASAPTEGGLTVNGTPLTQEESTVIASTDENGNATFITQFTDPSQFAGLEETASFSFNATLGQKTLTQTAILLLYNIHYNP